MRDPDLRSIALIVGCVAASVAFLFGLPLLLTLLGIHVDASLVVGVLTAGVALAAAIVAYQSVSRQIAAQADAVAKQIAATEASVAKQIAAENEHRREDESRRLEAERRQQAEQVTAWVVRTGTRSLAWVVGSEPPPPPGEPYVEIGLANASQGAVYTVHIDVKCASPADIRLDMRDYVRIENEAHAWLPVLPPGHRGQYTIDLPENSSPLIDSADVHFVDQRGLRWRRAAQGGALSPSNEMPFTAPMYDDDGPWDPQEEDGFIELQYLEDP